MSILSVLYTRQFQQVRPAPSEVIGCAAVVIGLLASGQNLPRGGCLPLVVIYCPRRWPAGGLGGHQPAGGGYLPP